MNTLIISFTFKNYNMWATFFHTKHTHTTLNTHPLLHANFSNPCLFCFVTYFRVFLLKAVWHQDSLHSLATFSLLQNQWKQNSLGSKNIVTLLVLHFVFLSHSLLLNPNTYILSSSVYLFLSLCSFMKRMQIKFNNDLSIELSLQYGFQTNIDLTPFVGLCFYDTLYVCKIIFIKKMKKNRSFMINPIQSDVHIC
jgi:hypothetical protein